MIGRAGMPTTDAVRRGVTQHAPQAFEPRLLAYLPQPGGLLGGPAVMSRRSWCFVSAGFV
jgi:hypothetical protein